MTLITYLPRVHFADGVLEEALASELELHNYSKPLLLCISEHQDTEFAERVLSGVPYHCSPIKHHIDPDVSVTKTVTTIIKTAEQGEIDVIVAFGSSRAISIAGECCQILWDRENKGSFGTQPRSSRSRDTPDFFAVPGIDGLPDLSKPRRDTRLSGVLYTGTGPQPSIAIYDPTLTLGECLVQTASAAVNTLSRCIEAYLSENYNPPAEGIAYDGIVRIVKYMPSTTQKDDLNYRREQMAASLEGTLALQKGSGITQELTDALVVVSGLALDEGALKRLLLPLSFDIMELTGSKERAQLIRDALGIPANGSFKKGLEQLIDNLPLPTSLEAHGLAEEHIAQAAAMLVQGRTNRVPDAATLVSMMASLQPMREPVIS